MVEIKKLNEKSFPALLSEMSDPPKALYLCGTLPPPETKLLAVVGSRKMSGYAKEACAHLIAGLSGYPIGIVSGLALGVDGAAHRAALAANLLTIAIPGSGLAEEVLYPRAHLGLAREIVASGGGLLSEMEPEERATSYSFPKRNRLMAGIAHAVLVVEAGVQSGTLITAKLAADYGRELLIVPHSIFSEGGAGGHVFMRLGASPVRTAADILDALGFEARTESDAPPVEMSADEIRVMELLRAPLSRDECIRALGIPAAAANVLLAEMELRGLIQETLGEIRRNI